METMAALRAADVTVCSVSPSFSLVFVGGLSFSRTGKARLPSGDILGKETKLSILVSHFPIREDLFRQNEDTLCGNIAKVIMYPKC